MQATLAKVFGICKNWELEITKSLKLNFLLFSILFMNFLTIEEIKRKHIFVCYVTFLAFLMRAVDIVVFCTDSSLHMNW